MIKNIEYVLRRNLGNYEHAELKVSSALSDTDDAVKETKELMTFVSDALTGTGPFAKVPKDPNQTELKVDAPARKPETTITPKKPTPAKEPVKEAVKADEEVKIEKPKTEEKAKEVKKPAEVKPASKKISKTTPYNRDMDTHKALLSGFLDSKYPEWRKSDNLKKAAAASKALVGTPFLDENGDMLDSFKESFSKAMEA